MYSFNSNVHTIIFLALFWLSLGISYANLSKWVPDSFQTKNPNLDKFWGDFQRKILVYCMTIWSILRQLKIFYDHLIYFAVIPYISPRFGILYQEKSGNPGSRTIAAIL
jgi:hypothetical protein